MLLIIFLSSCGLLKKRVVDMRKVSVDTSAHVDSSTVSKTETIDKSETVVLEKAKGTVYTKPIETTTKTDLQDLLSGLKTVVQDSGLFKITQSYDSITKQIKTQVQVKPQAVDFDINKTTTTKNDIHQSTGVNTKLKKDQSTSYNEKTKHTTSTPNTIVISIVVVLIILGILAYLFLKKKAEV